MRMRGLVLAIGLGLGLVWSSVATAAGGGLIDGRGWELVSPPNKDGATVGPTPEEGGLVQASEAGGALTFASTGPVVGGGAGNRAFERVQNLAVRGAGGGWSTTDIEAPNSMLGEHLLGTSGSEYLMFTGELSGAVVSPRGEGFLSPLQGNNRERTVFTRDLGSGVFTPLVTEGNTRSGVHFGGASPNSLEFRGAAPDLSHVVMSSKQPLTSEVAAAGKEDLYEAAGGGLRLVSVLPNGHPASEPGEGKEPRNAELGDERDRIVRNAVSSDGGRVVWEAEGEVNHLYLRSMDRPESVQLDVVQPGASGAYSEVQFEGANSDDSRIYFEDGQQLTPGSNAEQHNRDLYVAEVHGSPMEVTVTDLTKDSGGPAGVDGNIIGYGEDAAGASVYYVANGALSPGAVAGSCEFGGGACTLYVQHYSNANGGWGSPRKIAQLSGGDQSDWGGAAKDSLVYETARVSENGRFLVFMSQEPLTGFDNRDAVSGAADQEVFLFDEASGGLRCVSCNPSGARPHGLYDPGNNQSLTYPLVDPLFLWHGQWLSGSVPGWEPSETARGLYQPRFLSDSGRVFFDSAAGLVPGDSNGVEDVYEWEPEGTPGAVCDSGVGGAGEAYVRGGEVATEASEGAERAMGVSAGCVGLVSSGSGSEESAFLDANESGSDAFFVTSARLSSTDTDTSYDIYDAHVCSEALPCPAGAVAAAPVCGSAEGCRGSRVSVEGAPGVPGTVSVSGAGNALGEQPQPAVATRRALTRAQLLASALRSCKRARARARRAACERTARKRYASVRKASKANRRSGR